jgi:hypothetical protein
MASCDPVRIEVFRIVMMAARRDGSGLIAAQWRPER